MKIAKWFAGTPRPASRGVAAASPAAPGVSEGWAKGLSKRLASLRVALAGDRSAGSRPSMGSATRPVPSGRPTRPLPAIPDPSRQARVAPIVRPLPMTPSAEAAAAGLSATIVDALRPPSPERLAAKWTARIGAAVQHRPYLDSLAASGLSPRAAGAVTELIVAMAQAKMRDDIAHGFVPDPQDRLVETRYLAFARSVVTPAFREQTERLGEAAACDTLRRRARTLRDAANAAKSALCRSNA